MLLNGIALWLGLAGGLCGGPPVAKLSSIDFRGTTLASPPSPEDQATSLARALNEFQLLPAAPFTLVAGTARYTTSSPFVMVATSPERTYSMNWFPLSATGSVTELNGSIAALKLDDSQSVAECFPTDEPICRAATHDGEGFLRASSLPDVLLEAMPTVLKAKGIDATIVSVVAAPDLSFEVTRGGQIWMVSVNPVDLQDLLRSHTPLHRLTSESLLSRMRLTRGYPSDLDGPSFREATAMTAALALGLWICTGILIHWQMKSSHRWVKSFGVRL